MGLRKRMPAALLLTVVILLFTGLLSITAYAGVLVVDDPLQSSTSGTRDGGTFVSGGWKVNNTFDAIYWHLPHPICNGAAEFYVRGINPNESSGEMADKTELFHMYDYTYNSADTNYDGYRNNYYKHFVRKSGTLNGAKTDSMELLLKIGENYMEPDTAVLSWDPARNYLFRLEWYPDGNSSTIMKLYRDGELLYTMSEPYSYLPAGHSVRIGASSRRLAGTSAPINAIFSYFKVWDNSPVPPAPQIILPVNGQTVNSTNPRIHWSGDNLKYHVRVNTTNNPDTGIVWDSGEVSSLLHYADTGVLSNNATYYLFIRIANGIGWSPWSGTGHTFTVDSSYLSNPGIVRMNGCCFQDDGGNFLGLGATYMSAIRHCRNDRNLFRENIAFLASRGFNYVRILSMVGWEGREIPPITFTRPNGDVVSGWSDYWQQFRDMIDIIYSYGMRTEVTIFADAQTCMPNESDRYNHMNVLLANLVGREHKVMHLEVANEYWQNGFPDPGGVNTVRTFGAYLAVRTNMPVALSSPSDTSNDGILQMYSGSAADIATVHFERDTHTSEGGWLPVRDCWRVASLYPQIPPVSSNEPVGPGSSVNTETDPVKLVSAAVFAWISKLPTYVFHSKAGVGADVPFQAMAGVNDFRFTKDLLPNDLPNWTRNDGKEASSPFTAYCGNQANKYWTDVPGASDGCHRNIGSIKGKQFVCYPQGILAGGLTLQARKDMSYIAYDPISRTAAFSGSLAAGQYLNLPTGHGAYIIKGTFTGVDLVSPGPVVRFAVNPGDSQNVLTWQNPPDDDFFGTKIVYRTDRYPTSASDGTLVCDKAGTAGGREHYTHTGLSNGIRCYYTAFAYDDYSVPNYSVGATAAGTPVAGQCFSERFTYPDGNLTGNRSWTGSSQIQLLSEAVKINGGADNVTVTHDVTCSNATIQAHVRVKAGSGTNTLWGFWIDDANGNNLARWYGSGATARPRIGGTGLVLDPVNLTGGWDDLEVRINTASNMSEFYFNGTFLGTLDHSSTGAGDAVGRIMLERVYGSLTSEFVYLDDVVIGPSAIDINPPAPVTGFSAVSQPSQVSLSWINPASSDLAGVRIVYNTAGFPTSPYDGMLVYDGAGASCVQANPPSGIIYYAAYAYDDVMNFSTAATTTIIQAGSDCYSESFAYSDGNLNGKGDWTGSATTQIAVEGQSVKITGGAGIGDALHILTCSGSQLGVRVKIKKGSGTSAIWNLYIDDGSGNNLARWYGTGTSVRGRVGTGAPTSVGTMTGGWDDAYVKIDFAQNRTQFVFNGTVLGTVSHSAGDNAGWIRIERADSSAAAGQYVYLDDISVGPADVTAPSAVIGPPSALVARTGPVSYTVNFEEPVFGFNSASDIQVNATGSAASGTVTVTGSGAGPYNVVLGNITGEGTLGITVKAAVCMDAAGNSNTTSASSTVFTVLGTDGRISAAKLYDDTAAVNLGNKVLYLKSTGFGYIEEPDRSCGIRLEGSISADEGDLVCLTGTMETTSYGERTIQLATLSSAGSSLLRPLGMNTFALKSTVAIGLYARIWGLVKTGSITENSYTLVQADGSEIRVYTRGIPAVRDSDFVMVSGAVTSESTRVIYEK